MRNLYLLLLSAWLCFGVGLLMSCGDDDDNDDANEHGDEEAADTCEETTTILASLDEVSALLGISAAELLDATGNGFTLTATYTVDTSLLTQSPLGGETELTVTISFAGGEIREIASVPVDSGSGQDIAVDCPDRLEVEVSVAFVTADGAFNETWPAILTQTDAAESSPSLTADFDPYEVEGTFEIVSIEGPTPDSVTGDFSTLAVDPYSGALEIFVEQSGGEGADAWASQSEHVALMW